MPGTETGPLFSVIIPTYNRAVYLRRTLRSVREQEFKDYEVIVVNDGSTDQTASLLCEYSWVRVLQQDNRGAGAARNYGGREASGKYLAFVDSDDIWFPWTLVTFAALIDEYQFPSMISARVVEFSDEAALHIERSGAPRGEIFGDYLAASRTGYYVGSGMAVFHRDEFLESGGFVTSPINAEDHDLALRLGTAPKFVQVTKPVTLGWRRHAGGASMNIRRTYEGVRYLVEQEELGKYPGGPERSRERKEIIARHLRPVALECLSQGMRREAWTLYRMTIKWHALLGRVKFLLGFWPLLGRALVARR